MRNFLKALGIGVGVVTWLLAFVFLARAYPPGPPEPQYRSYHILFTDGSSADFKGTKLGSEGGCTQIYDGERISMNFCVPHIVGEARKEPSGEAEQPAEKGRRL